MLDELYWPILDPLRHSSKIHSGTMPKDKTLTLTNKLKSTRHHIAPNVVGIRQTEMS